MSFSKLVTVGVLLIAAVVSLQIAAPWYDYLRLKGAMRESVRQAQMSTDATVISAVLAKARELKVPLDARDIHLERSRHGEVRLWAAYDVTLHWQLGFSHTQRFRPEVRAVQ